MNVCDLDSPSGRLARAFAELKQSLAEVRETWNDDTARRFDQEHLREIPARLHLLVTAVDRLAGEVRQAERDCSDRPDDSDAPLR